MDNLEIINSVLGFLQNKLGSSMKLIHKKDEKKQIAFYCDPKFFCLEKNDDLKEAIKSCMKNLKLEVSDTEIFSGWDAVYLKDGRIISYTIFDAGSPFNPTPASVIMITVIEEKHSW